MAKEYKNLTITPSGVLAMLIVGVGLSLVGAPDFFIIVGIFTSMLLLDAMEHAT